MEMLTQELTNLTKTTAHISTEAQKSHLLTLKFSTEPLDYFSLIF